MKYLFMSLVILISGCGVVTVTSYPVTPSDIKVSEEVCMSNGGLKSVFVSAPTRINGQNIQIECNNGVKASKLKGK
jgi:hypothetical protein